MNGQYDPDLVPWTPPVSSHPAIVESVSRADRIRIVRQVLVSPVNHGLSPADMAMLIVDSIAETVTS